MVGMAQEKSTALNVIAEKTGINRDSIYNKFHFYTDYVSMYNGTWNRYFEKVELLPVMMYLII